MEFVRIFKKRLWKILDEGVQFGAFSNDVTSCHPQLLLAQWWKMRFYVEQVSHASNENGLQRIFVVVNQISPWHLPALWSQRWANRMLNMCMMQNKSEMHIFRSNRRTRCMQQKDQAWKWEWDTQINCKLSHQVPLGYYSVWSNGASVSLNKDKGQKRFESDLTKKRRSRASMSTQLGRRRCSGAILSSLELHFLWSAPNPLMDGTLGFAQKCFLFVGSIHCCGFWTKTEIVRTFVQRLCLCNVCVFAMFPI